VDYADRWTVTGLIWLLRNALLHQSFLPDLAVLLGRLAGMRLAVASLAGAHSAILEAIAIFKELSKNEPRRFGRHLMSSYGLLADILDAM
jgi:hypothetical protein